MRPVDLIFPGRAEAIKSCRCMQKPIGCGKPCGDFKDIDSENEYYISALCQECQDRVFHGKH